MENVQSNQKILTFLEEKLGAAQKKLDDFADGFKMDPVHALEWAGETYEAAAMRRLINYIKPCLVDGKGNYAYVVEYLKDTILRNSQWYSNGSSSPCANMSKAADNAATGKLYNALIFKFGEPESTKGE